MSYVTLYYFFGSPYPHPEIDYVFVVHGHSVVIHDEGCCAGAALGLTDPDDLRTLLASLQA